MESSKNNNPKKKKKRSQAVAFGRTYFHALGGTTPAIVVPKPTSTDNYDDSDSHDPCAHVTKTILLQGDENMQTKKSNHTLMCYQWKYPPWIKAADNSDDDSDVDATIRQAVATSQSTLFVTQAGKVYQTGTLHGHVYTSPTCITIAMPIKCVEIAAGRHFCLARMQDGLAVLSWGAGHFGQLGVQTPVSNSSSSDDSDDDDDDDDDNENPSSKSAKKSEKQQHQQQQQQQQQITFTSRPILIEGLLPRAVGSPVQQIAAGDWHGMALTESGRVFCWGSNRSQQCGRKPPKSGNSSNNGIGANPAPTILTPAPVPFAAAVDSSSKSTTAASTSVASDWLRIAKIAGGRSHSVALTRDTGQVYCWGSTLYGQCGNFVRRTPVVPPRRVEGLQDLSIIQIAAAGCHTLALTSGGRVFSWGQCHEGQLGVSMPSITPNNNKSSSNNATDNNDAHSGTTAAITVSAAAPRPRLVADLDFVAIAAGQEWKTQQKIQQRRADKEAATSSNAKTRNDGNTAAADTAVADDAVNDHKVEPASSSLSPATPTTTSTTTPDILTSPLSTIPRITQIYAGAFYSVAVSSSGHVYAFGSNDAGQLGVSTPRDLPFRETGHPHKSPIADASSTTATTTTVASVTPSTVRELNVQSFDSRHLVLLPVRVEAAMSINVRTVACGPNHLWCIGEERDDSDCSTNNIGRTQYEIQEGHRRQALLRSRAHRQQQKQQHQTSSNGFASSGVMLVPTTQSKLPPPVRVHEEEAAAPAKAISASSSLLPSLEVRPSPLVDFLSPNDLPSPATTTTTVAADGLLTPSTDGGAEDDEEQSTALSSSPVVASAVTSMSMTNTTTTTSATTAAVASGQAASANNNASSSLSPPSSPNRNVKRTRSRGIIRRLSSGIRKRLIGHGGGKTKAREEGGQLPLGTESERGHHHRRSRNHQNISNNIYAVTAGVIEGGGGGGGGDGPRTRWRKRNTIG